MSDFTANGRSSFGNLGLQNVTRPKFQPMRVKALLDFCESDDDDEDEKPGESEDESDSDDPQPLLQNDSIENTSQEFLTGSKDKNEILKTSCTLPEGSHDIAVVSTSSVGEKINCISDNEECKVSNVNAECHPSVTDISKLEISNNKCEEKLQEHNIEAPALRRQQTSIIHDGMNIALLPQSMSIYKGDYNPRFDTNKTFQPVNSIQSQQENLYMSDVLSKKKEVQLYNTSSENQMQIARNNENFLLTVSKEDPRYKCVRTFNEQTSKDSEEENYKISSSASESVSCASQASGNILHSVKYNSQYSVAKCEANEKYTPAKNASTELNLPSSNEMGKLSTINQLTSETPLKHAQVGSTHITRSGSQKQLFQTPQSKLSTDLSKSHIPTPSTLLSNWSHNIIHTPMTGKNFTAKEYVQTPRNPVYTPVVSKIESSRYMAMDQKNVRRPLADATLAHADSMPYSSEIKSLLLHTHPETKVSSESQQEDRNRKKVGLSEVLLIQSEGNYDKNLRLMDSTEESKENKHATVSDTLLGNNRNVIHDKKENKQIIIGSNTGIKVIQDSSRKFNEESDIASNAKCKDLHTNHYQTYERQPAKLRQIVDKVANVQFTVPLSIPPQRQGKTLFVKNREYLILGVMGRGMSGEVLRVQDVSCGELRAIKCVDLNKMDKDSAQGCLDEITMLHKLQAPCVVKMFDYHIVESMVYVVMEMGDTDLSRLIKSISQEKKIPLTMILYYWTEMLTAVKHIHDNGVIHSDLKPANFLLVRGRLKLIDFGIASNINSDMTSVLKNNPIGTLNYISPEALMDIGGNADSPTHNVKYKISFKSDVWSLGCILYSLVYGHTPFHHLRSQWAKVSAITNPKPNISFPTAISLSDDSRHCEQAPPILIDVMRKCLQHDPKARPTVSQLLEVQYVPTTHNAGPALIPDIPASVLVKIKHTLSEKEWRQLVQVLDTKRHI